MHGGEWDYFTHPLFEYILHGLNACPVGDV
jgi:hypothetical protein